MSWQRNSFPVQPTDRQIMSSRGNRHTLNFRNVSPDDFGNYRLVEFLNSILFNYIFTRIFNVFLCTTRISVVSQTTRLAVPRNTWRCPVVRDQPNSTRHRGADRRTATIWRGRWTAIHRCRRFGCYTENWWYVNRLYFHMITTQRYIILKVNWKF